MIKIKEGLDIQTQFTDIKIKGKCGLGKSRLFLEKNDELSDIKDEVKDENIADGIICSFCDKPVARIDIIVHTEKHVGVSRFKCEMCRKSFPEKNKLKLHIRTHTGEKPYKCETCYNSFSTKGYLDRHSKTVHSKEIVFQCDQCPQTCSSKRRLLGHRNVKHAVNIFKCNICKSILITEENLRKHTGSTACKNKTEKVYNCEKCGKCFRSKQGLDEHDRVHENIKPFPCEICGKYFRQKRQVKAHRNAVHVDIRK